MSMWLVRATDKVLEDLNLLKLEGELFGHKFVNSTALVSSHYGYKFFMRRGFQDITPVNLSKEDFTHEKVLFVRLGGYGDVLLASTMIEGYKQMNPDVVIDWLGMPSSSDLLLGNPHITKPLVIMPHELGLIYDQYDQVYDLTHSIECNSEATYQNPYDNISAWTGIPLPKEVRPYLYFTDAELEWGKNYLLDRGFDFNKPIIGIAIESSSPRRTWPPPRSVEVARLLSSVGWQVILFGVYNKVVCDIPRVLNIVGSFSNFRVVASLVKCCDLIVSPFTAYLHLSQAFEHKKLLILAGPWDGITEAKYYPNRWVIQGPFRCAPCFRLGGMYDRCEISQDGIGECMRSITVDEVYHKVKLILDDLKPDKYYERTPIHRICPCCNGGGEIYTAYGSYFYLRCSSCNSIYIDRLPDQVFYQYSFPSEREEEMEMEEAKRILNYVGEKLKSPIRNVFDIGCGSGAFLQACKKLGRNVSGIDIAKGVKEEILKRYGIITEEADFDIWPVDPMHWNKYQLITMRFSIEHLNNPFDALLKCNRMLADSGGYVFIVTHGAEILGSLHYVRKNYVMLGGTYPGEHIVIFSQEGLRRLVNKVGLELVESKVLENGRMEALLKRKS